MITEPWRIKDWVVGLKVFLLEKHTQRLNETCSGNLSSEVLWTREEGHWPFKTETCTPPDPKHRKEPPPSVIMYLHFTRTFICLHLYMSTACMSSTWGDQKRAWIPRNWSHRQLWATMLVLRIKCVSSARAASVFTHGNRLPNPWTYFFH